MIWVELVLCAELVSRAELVSWAELVLWVDIVIYVGVEILNVHRPDCTTYELRTVHKNGASGTLS